MIITARKAKNIEWDGERLRPIKLSQTQNGRYRTIINCTAYYFGADFDEAKAQAETIAVREYLHLVRVGMKALNKMGYQVEIEQ